MENENLDNKQPKIGLVLGSGGAKGLSHIGVLKVLHENNIPISYIAGSSIGALLGVGYAHYQDALELEKIALAANWRRAIKFFDPGQKGGLLKGKKLEELLKQWLPDTTFENLKIPVTICATDIINGERVNITKGDIHKAIRGSFAVPPVFRPVRFEDHLIVDGGLSNPLPIDIVKKMGANIIIAINLDSGKFDDTDDNFKKITDDSTSSARISMRSLNIMRHYMARKYLKMADVVIEPSVSEIGLVGWKGFFSSKNSKKLIQAGELAALKKIPEIKALLNN